MHYNPDLLSSHPPSVKDISMFAPTDLPWSTIEELIRGNGGPFLSKITLLEVWEHGAVGCNNCGIHPPPTPEGHRSLFVRVVYQHTERTLLRNEVNEFTQAIHNSLSRAGVILR